MDDYIKREDELIKKCDAKAEIEGYFAHIIKIDKRRKTKIEAMRIDLLSCIGGIAPVVDVRENVRGHWTNVQIYVTGSSMADCSICGVTVHDSFMGNAAPNFCPNCGADMRGEKYV